MAENKSRPPRPSIAKLSKTPSWIMLGFIIGAGFILALPRSEPPAPRPIIVTAAPEKPARPEPPQLPTVETLFEQWADYAVWDHDATQVALWDAAVGAYADLYEVRRIDGAYYFRSIPQLTNRPLNHGKRPPPECPFQFTETEQQYRDWREEGRYERPAETSRVPLTMPTEKPAMPAPVPTARPIVPPAPIIDKSPSP